MRHSEWKGMRGLREKGVRIRSICLLIFYYKYAMAGCYLNFTIITHIFVLDHLTI